MMMEDLPFTAITKVKRREIYVDIRVYIPQRLIFVIYRLPVLYGSFLCFIFNDWRSGILEDMLPGT